MIRANLSPVDLAWVDTKDNYVYAEHLQELNQLLLKVASGEVKRLAVFMPPRHGKSELISKYFPAWYLGQNPECRVILTSYEADFAAGWSHKVRDLIAEHGRLFKDPITVDQGSAARNRWDIYRHNGGMQSAGVGGAITGKGAKILIIDDPVKNAEQANSDTYRQKAKDWYSSTAYTRLEPDGAVILIQTRWHEDDLGGWLLSESSDDWTVLKLPAINDKGKPLWPDRFNLKRLMEIKAEVGQYWFSAMYQQEPQPPEGGILKRGWLQYYDPKDKKGYLSNSTIYTAYDLAISEKETADYTVSCTAKVSGIDGHIYITDWTRDHLDFPKQQRLVVSNQTLHNADLIAIEDTAYQAALPQSLKNHKLPIKTMKPLKDKVIRATSAFTMMEQGMVHLPLGHPLIGEFENEYTHFPTGKHDDMIDATSMVLTLAMQGARPFTDRDKSSYYKFSAMDNNMRKGNRPRHVRL